MAQPAILQTAIDQFSDLRWRLNNLYYITDKDGKEVGFRMNDAQERLFDEMHLLNIILKARQRGFCLDPATRVLTVDLRWVPIVELSPGDKVVSVDECTPGGKGRARKMRVATVVATTGVVQKAYRITFDDGRSVVCTGGHRWLSKMTNPQGDWRAIESNNKKKLRVGTLVRWVTKPWSAPDFEDGWFGGMLDGEGSIAKTNVSASINVCQRTGPVWDRLLRYGKTRGYNYRIEDDKAVRPSKYGKTPVPKMVIGRIDEIFRVIGQTRPSRFIGNRFWEGRDPPGKKSGVGWAKIVSIEPLGERPMVDLQTTTGTYIAEGFVSHNSTFIQIYMLDACMFNSNIRSGTIAHTREDAEAIFRDKVKYPYERLPDQLKAANPATQDSARELTFANNSSLRVGTSLRSGTFQYLHISEHGKICAKYPDKAMEIRTGALNTVQVGQQIFIESTAEGQQGDFFEFCKRAQDLQRQGKPLTPLDFKFHFFPWWEDAGYTLDFDVTITAEQDEYFRKLKEQYNIELTDGQKAWYVKKLETQGDKMGREYPSTPDEAFAAAVEGAYYSREMARIRRDGRITRLPYDPTVPVNTFWDIGRNDAMVIWFHQHIGRWHHFIDYYENHSEGLGHYAGFLRSKEYTYGVHHLPHDGAVTDVSVDDYRSRAAILEGLGVRPVTVVPRTLDVTQDIQIVRTKLPFCVFDEAKCAKGIAHMDNYRREWDDKLAVWRDKPRHDAASDGADGFRTWAMGYRKPEPEDDDDYDPRMDAQRSDSTGY